MKFDKPEIRNNHKKGRYKLDQIVIDAEDRLKLKYKIVKIFDKGGYDMYKAERLDKHQYLSIIYRYGSRKIQNSKGGVVWIEITK